MEFIENIFHEVVQAGIVLLEFAGVAILLVTALRCVVNLLRRDPHVRLMLAEGIALALEFKLGGEVLRTVIARDWSELGILGAIIALRGALTFLIHWEIKTEESKLGVIASKAYEPREQREQSKPREQREQREQSKPREQGIEPEESVAQKP